MMPTIIFVSNWDWVLYNFRLPLARALMKKGLDVILVCPEGKYSGKFEELGFHWQNWKLNRRSTNPWYELRAIFDLVSIYRKLRPQVVHHFTIKPIVYGSVAAIFSPPEAVINNFTGLGYLFGEAQKAAFLRRIVILVLRLVLRGNRFHAAFQNEHDRNKLVSLKVVKEEDTTLIPGTGVNLKVFYPKRDIPQAGDLPIVVMASRLLWEKGVAEFVEAARQINQEYIQAKFWLVGDPDYGNPDSITDDQLDVWKKEGFVEFLGHRKEMPDLLRQADIAVLPSRYSEGVPLFLLESAATGLSLVGSDIAGCRMVIEDGVNGFIVPKDDLKKLVEVIFKLVEDADLRGRMGRESRKIAESRFEQGKIISQYMEMYATLGV